MTDRNSFDERGHDFDTLALSRPRRGRAPPNVSSEGFAITASVRVNVAAAPIAHWTIIMLFQEHLRVMGGKCGCVYVPKGVQRPPAVLLRASLSQLS